MSDIRDRIIKRMRDLNLRQVDLINLLGVSKGTVSKWISGVNVPSSEILPDLAGVLNTSPSWLIKGDGVDRSEVVLHSVESWDSNTPLEDDEIEIPFFKDFSFACGSGSVGEALASEKRRLRMSKTTLRNRAIERSNAVATQATGDSMSPTIKDGDTIHLDIGRKTIKDGKIFAICHGGLFMVKRLYSLPLGGVRIVSDNYSEYPEIKLSADELKGEQFEVIGWVWQISSLESW